MGDESGALPAITVSLLPLSHPFLDDQPDLVRLHVIYIREIHPDTSDGYGHQLGYRQFFFDSPALSPPPSPRISEASSISMKSSISSGFLNGNTTPSALQADLVA